MTTMAQRLHSWCLVALFAGVACTGPSPSGLADASDASTPGACRKPKDNEAASVKEEGLSLLQKTARYPYARSRRAPLPPPQVSQAERHGAHSSMVPAGDGAALAQLQHWSDIAVAEDLQRLTELLQNPPEPVLEAPPLNSDTAFLPDAEETSLPRQPELSLLDQRSVDPMDEPALRSMPFGMYPQQAIRTAPLEAELGSSEPLDGQWPLQSLQPLDGFPAGGDEDLLGHYSRFPAREVPLRHGLGLAETAERRHSAGAWGRMAQDSDADFEDVDVNATAAEEALGSAASQAKDALGSAAAQATDFYDEYKGQAKSNFITALTFGKSVPKSVGAIIWSVILLVFIVSSCYCCCHCFRRRNPPAGARAVPAGRGA